MPKRKFDHFFQNSSVEPIENALSFNVVPRPLCPLQSQLKDRFIPNRSSIDQDGLMDSKAPSVLLYKQMDSSGFNHQKIDRTFPIKSPPPVCKTECKLRFMGTEALPGLTQDFYDSPLLWSSTNRLITGLGLGENSSYIASFSYGKKNSQLFSSGIPLRLYTLVELNSDTFVASFEDGYLRFYQISDLKPISRLLPVGDTIMRALTPLDKNTLVFADRVGVIRTFDVRESLVKKHVEDEQNPYYYTGITYNGAHLLALGTNENIVMLWDVRAMGRGPIHFHQHHQAAIKGIQFLPDKPHMLLSGGGSACRKLCLWNVLKTEEYTLRETSAQITGIYCLKNYPQYFMTTHGYSDPSVQSWKIMNNYILFQSKCVNDPERSRNLCIAGSTENTDFCVTTTNQQLRFFTTNLMQKSNGQPATLNSFPLMVR